MPGMRQKTMNTRGTEVGMTMSRGHVLCHLPAFIQKLCRPPAPQASPLNTDGDKEDREVRADATAWRLIPHSRSLGLYAALVASAG